ncbi:putative ibr finger domain protein [Diaporthe ampelina]|uniref:Putative ibr finger domain protein n=1 Tax=Diaporthe ampelina TaxID=1214573 RepID=A0A0G2FYB0_9PEZI|nr:putative ibr finger domain protein [Diaporthe ampelina]
MDARIAELDEQTARLIVQLQLEDLNEVSSKAKDKGPKGAPTDFACALAIYENDLKAVNDREMAQSIAYAVRTDSQIIKEVLAEEQQASEDRRMALEANGTAAPALPVRTEGAAVNGGHDEIDDNLLEKMSAIYMGDGEIDNACEEDAIYNDDSAPGFDVTNKKNPAAKRRCCTCGDDVPFYDVARAPCGHEYCRGCLQELFTLSLTDETLFPPRCCREPIPAEKNRFFLTSQLLSQFQARKVEMETPDRTYCHVPECSKFIPPDNIEHQIGRCVVCNARTCSVCKAAAHVGDCPEDPATKVLDGIAAENGWRRCNGCRRLVDLMAGCNHISKSMPQPALNLHPIRKLSFMLPKISD